MTVEHNTSFEASLGLFGGITATCSCGWRKRVRDQKELRAAWDKHEEKYPVIHEHWLNIHKRNDGTENWLSCGRYWEFCYDLTTYEHGIEAWKEHKRRTGDNCNGW